MALAVKIDNSTGAKKAIPQEGLQHADIVFEEYMAKGRVDAVRRGIPERLPRSRGQHTIAATDGPVHLRLFPWGSRLLGGRSGPLARCAARCRPGVHCGGPAQLPARLLPEEGEASSLRHLHPPHGGREVRGGPGGAAAAAAPVHLRVPRFDRDRNRGGLARSGDQPQVLEDSDPALEVGCRVWQVVAFPGFRSAPPAGRQQISATNIVVLRAGVRYKYHDDPETLLAGTDHGTGYIAAGGQYLEIRWSKADRSSTHSTSRRSTEARCPSAREHLGRASPGLGYG